MTTHSISGHSLRAWTAVLRQVITQLILLKHSLSPGIAGIAHNDLKTDNIGLISGDTKHIKIFDFGQAAPVTKTQDIAAYQDYWRMAETIAFDIDSSQATTFNGFLDDGAEAMVFDGKAPTDKEFPISSHLYSKFIDAFVTLKWATRESKDGKKMECTLAGGLFKLPA